MIRDIGNTNEQEIIKNEDEQTTVSFGNDESDKETTTKDINMDVTTSTCEEVETNYSADVSTNTNRDTDPATESTPRETTAINVDTVDIVSTDKTPRMDTVDEDETVNNVVTEDEVVTEQETFTTPNPKIYEAVTKPTTVTIISVEENYGEVTIVTIVKTPTIAIDMDTGDENKDTTTEDNDEITTEKTKIAVTTILTIENDTSTDPEEMDLTTTSPEIGDHEFQCTEAVADDKDEDVPLECVFASTEEEMTVFLVIPRDSLGGNRKKLFDKNIKIVVKDFMIMDNFRELPNHLIKHLATVLIQFQLMK